MEKLFTIGEVAEMLRVSKPTVYRLMSGGELKCVKIGGRTLFKESELKRFIDNLGKGKK
jgi:excisionase family DNA binding protein